MGNYEKIVHIWGNSSASSQFNEYFNWIVSCVFIIRYQSPEEIKYFKWNERSNSLFMFKWNISNHIIYEQKIQIVFTYYATFSL